MSEPEFRTSLPPKQRLSTRSRIIIGVVAWIGVGLVVLSALNHESTKKQSTTVSRAEPLAVTQLGTVRIGAFNYVNPCDVLSADMLDAASGMSSNRQSIDAQIALKTYVDVDPARTYATECARWVDASSSSQDGDFQDKVTLAIKQFSSSELQKKLVVTDPKAVGIDDLTGQINTPVMFSMNTNTYSFTVENKVISLVGSFGNASAGRKILAELVKPVHDQLVAMSTRSATAPSFGGEGLQVGIHPYVGACAAFLPDDYRSIFKTEPDEGLVKTTFVENFHKPIPDEVTSSCRLSFLPAKTDALTGMTPSSSGLSVDVRVRQFRKASDLKDVMKAEGSLAITVPNIGDKAVMKTIDGGQGPQFVLLVQKANVLASLQIVREASGLITANKEQDQASLREVAKAVVAHVH